MHRNEDHPYYDDKRRRAVDVFRIFYWTLVIVLLAISLIIHLTNQ